MSKEMQYCLKNGIKVYPFMQHGFKSTAKQTFKDRHWYLEVDNNGKKIRYDKSLGTGILRGKALQEPIEKTYSFWYNKLIKNKSNERT
jgi:hypothetical protein